MLNLNMKKSLSTYKHKFPLPSKQVMHGEEALGIDERTHVDQRDTYDMNMRDRGRLNREMEKSLNDGKATLFDGF